MANRGRIKAVLIILVLAAALVPFLGQPYVTPVRADPDSDLHYVFGATDDYLDVPDDDGFSIDTTDELTIELYANITYTSSTRGLFEKINLEWQIFIGTGLLYFTVYDDTPGNIWMTCNGDISAEANKYQHYAFVVNATDTWLRIYVNGITLCTDTSASGLINPNAVGNLTIGKKGVDGFVGWQDEVRISNISRYPDPFTPSLAEFSCDGNTVALWHNEEGSGQTVTDACNSIIAQLGNSPGADDADPDWTSTSPLMAGGPDWYVQYRFNLGVTTLYANSSGRANGTLVGYADLEVTNITTVVLSAAGYIFTNHTYNANGGVTNTSNPFYLVVSQNYTVWSYAEFNSSLEFGTDAGYGWFYSATASDLAVFNDTEPAANNNGLNSSGVPSALYNGSDGANIYGLWFLSGGSFAWGYSYTANGSLRFDGDEIEASIRGLVGPWVDYAEAAIPFAYFGEDGVNPFGTWSWQASFGWCVIENPWNLWASQVTVPCLVEWGRPPPDIPGGNGNGNGDDPIPLIIIWACDDFLGVGCLNILALVIMAVIGIALGIAHASDMAIALIELIFAVMFTAMTWFPLWLGILISLVMALWLANIMRGYFTGGGVEE